MTDTQPNEHHRNILNEIEQEADQDLHPLLKKILDNLKPIGMGIGAIILVVGGYSGYTTYAKMQTKKLNNELGSILIQEDPAKRITSLNQFLSEHPSAMPVGTLLEVANAAMNSKDYQEAASAWSRVAGESEGEIEILALMGQARALGLDGKYEESLTVLDTIDTTAAKDFATPLSRQIAHAAEQAQDWKKALAAYEELKTTGAVTNTAFLDMKIAEIRAKMG
ncbi:tetratricopeptide repeat protein [Desulfoplanes sp.]